MHNGAVLSCTESRSLHPSILAKKLISVLSVCVYLCRCYLLFWTTWFGKIHNPIALLLSQGKIIA